MKKMRPCERREKILELLCIRRQDTIKHLAEEFQVSERTIKYDIEELTLTYPINTIRGRYGGGVKVKDGYYVGRNYLKPAQENLLLKLLPSLSEKDTETMNSILKDFSLDKGQKAC